MKPKIINREVKTTTTIRSNETIKYDDGSTKKNYRIQRLFGQ